MNKAFVKLICLFVLVCMMVSVFAGCTTGGNDGTSGNNPTQDPQGTEGKIDEIDYAASVKLDMNSETVKVPRTSSNSIIDPKRDGAIYTPSLFPVIIKQRSFTYYGKNVGRPFFQGVG